MRPAVLELISLLAQLLDPAVVGDRRPDLGPYRGRRAEGDPVGQIRAHPGREVAEDLPLAPCAADPRAGDLGGEDHASLRAGLGDPTGDLVARRRRQQDDRFGRVDEHLGGEQDVHVGADADAGECLLDPVGVGQHLEEVAARREQDVEFPAIGGLDHLRGVQSRGRWDREPPALRQRGGVVGVYR